MLNKGEWSPLRIGIILVVFFIVIVILNQIYSEESVTERWMICDYSIENTYKDTMKFRYKNDKLVGFYREEYAYAEKEKDIDELYEQYNSKKEGLNFDKYFKYDVTKESDGVSASTYIEVTADTDLFDDYFDNVGIDSTLAMEQVYTIVKSKYTCYQKEK